MLEEIRIKDLGVIADTVLPLGPGFTAITGETGAGKTMLVQALGLLMGARATADSVRTGCERARVSGVLSDLPASVATEVDELGGDIEDGELILTRSITSEGRSRATVGGASAPVGALARLADALFAVHGQSEQLRVRSQAVQREILDSFAGPQLAAELKEFRSVYKNRREAVAKLQEIEENLLERAREAARLREELEEITAVDPQPGEDEQLQQRIAVLSNAEEIRSGTGNALAALGGGFDGDGGGDAASLLAQAVRELERLTEHDPRLADIAENLRGIDFQLADVCRDLGNYLSDLDEGSGQELAFANERYAVLQQLQRRYGASVQDVLAYAAKAASRLAELDDDDSEVARLRELVAEASASERELGEKVSALRHAAAKKLELAVATELAALALPNAKLVVAVVSGETPREWGFDDIEFLLAPHPGATPKPLGKTASGGELSRVMLALEVVLAGSDPVPTFVFDEVDSGVGGAAAIEIGRRLAKLAETSQVIVVTHLAQVAAFADNHVQVQKDTAGGFTESSCVRLSGEARLREMARLLSGLSDSESALEHAAELLSLRG